LLAKLPPTPATLVNVPVELSNLVVPPLAPERTPVPVPIPPAVPNKFPPKLEPPPELVPVPELEPIPVELGPWRVPVVVLEMLSNPEPDPKPPVGPVEKGVVVVVKVGGLKPPPLVPFLFLPPELGMAVPGTSVITVLKPTGLKPAPKPPAPEAVVVPSNLTVPCPPVVMPADPTCVPPAPALDIPPAALIEGLGAVTKLALTRLTLWIPGLLAGLTKPELPEVEVNLEFALASTAAPKLISLVVTLPVVVPVPPADEVPSVNPPTKLTVCIFLLPLRLRRVFALFLEDTWRKKSTG
jgi:hypothetical protein